MEKEQNSVIPAQDSGTQTIDSKIEVNTESDKKTENSFGKFSTADELLKAYNALESEFTRRSQKLKEFEKNYGENGEKDEKAKESVRQYDIPEEILKEAEDKAKTQDGKFLTTLVGVLASKVRSTEEMASDKEVIDRVLGEEKNREAVINAYVEQIKRTSAPTTLPKGGAIPTLPARRATSVREAGDIAKAILEKLQ